MVSFILLGRKGGTSMVRKYRLTKMAQSILGKVERKRFRQTVICFVSQWASTFCLASGRQSSNSESKVVIWVLRFWA